MATYVNDCSTVFHMLHQSKKMTAIFFVAFVQYCMIKS